MKNNLKPNHYHNEHTVEPFEIIKKQPLQWHGFCYGNVIKYVQRYKDKNGIEDLYKAKIYMSKIIETIGEYDTDTIMDEPFLKDTYIIKKDHNAWHGFVYGVTILSVQTYINIVNDNYDKENAIKYIIIASQYLDELISIEESKIFDPEVQNQEFLDDLDELIKNEREKTTATKKKENKDINEPKRNFGQEVTCIVLQPREASRDDIKTEVDIMTPEQLFNKTE